MDNTVTNKIKHFSQLFALGPLKMTLKQKLHYFLSWSTITPELDIYYHKYKYCICKRLLEAVCLVTINIWLKLTEINPYFKDIA